MAESMLRFVEKAGNTRVVAVANAVKTLESVVAMAGSNFVVAAMAESNLL